MSEFDNYQAKEKRRAEEYKAFLDGLTVGAEIIAVSNESFVGRQVIAYRVIKRTAKQIVCSVNGRGEIRFWSENGTVVGGNRFRGLPQPSAPVDVLRVVTANKLRDLADMAKITKLDHLSEADLTALLDAIKRVPKDAA